MDWILRKWEISSWTKNTNANWVARFHCHWSMLGECNVDDSSRCNHKEAIHLSRSGSSSRNHNDRFTRRRFCYFLIESKIWESFQLIRWNSVFYWMKFIWNFVFFVFQTAGPKKKKKKDWQITNYCACQHVVMLYTSKKKRQETETETPTEIETDNNIIKMQIYV